MVIRIDHIADPRLDAYRGVRERDLLRNQGRFIVEGAIALDRIAGGSSHRLESVFLMESRVASLAEILGRLPSDVPVYVSDARVMTGIAGFHIHRGVLAVALRGKVRTAADLIAAAPPDAMILGLIGLSNHDNVGACFRNAEAFGAYAVLLDSQSCDPLYRKAIRVSSGAALTTPFALEGDGEAMFDLLQAHRFDIWALTPTRGDPLTSLEPPPRLALLLGAEGPGLPSSLMDRARRVSIPMASGFDSLNVATAGAIALAHVFSARNPVHAAGKTRHGDQRSL